VAVVCYDFSTLGQHPVSSRGVVACYLSDFVYLGKPCMDATTVSLSHYGSLKTV